MIRCMLCLLLLLAVPFANATLHAQTLDPMTAGRTYVIAFPDTTQNRIDSRFTVKQIKDSLTLFVYSSVSTKVRVSDGIYTDTFRIAPRYFERITLNRPGSQALNLIATESGKVLQNTAYRVEADAPIIVYAYMATHFGGEMWTPLPVESWGLEYTAVAMQGEVLSNPVQIYTPPGSPDNGQPQLAKGAPAEITVVSAYNNTTVTVDLPLAAQLADSAALTITMDRDEVYQLQSFVDTLRKTQGLPQFDITGAHIYADKPISVLSGNTRTLIYPDSAITSFTVGGVSRNSMKTMAMEALAPLDQHGTEFVATPTLDDRVRTGQPGENILEKRMSEFTRITIDGAGRVLRIGADGTAVRDSVNIPANGFYEDVRTQPIAHYYRTSKPAQAFTFPAPVSKNLTATGGSASYDAWGGFMVELTPREQWTTFAPYTAPAYPASIKHYVNIVTDTGSRSKILDESNLPIVNWNTIPGTGLIWAMRGVTPGVTKHFRGLDSTARFGVYAYGLMKGHEEYRPGGTPDYEEYLALSYGYPVAPRRAVLSRPDSLDIQAEGCTCCGTGEVVIRALNTPKPVGLREIRLDSAASSNVALQFIDPASPADIIGKSYAKVHVVRDPYRDAHAALIVTDRTGASRRVDVDFHNIGMQTPAGLDLGEVRAGDSVEKSVAMINTSTEVQQVQKIEVNGVARIVSPDPLPNNGPALEVPPGDTLRIGVKVAAPKDAGNLLRDTVRVTLGCTKPRIPVVAYVVRPLMQIWNTRLDTLESIKDRPVTEEIQLCNRGTGTLHLGGEPGLVWDDTAFTLPASTLDSFRRGLDILPGDCIYLSLTFRPVRGDGVYRTVARFATNSIDREGSDSLIWIGRATSTSDVERDNPMIGFPDIVPNPAIDRAEIHVRLRKRARVEVRLYSERWETVLEMERDLHHGDMTIPLRLDNLPNGLYYCYVTIGEKGSATPLWIHH